MANANKPAGLVPVQYLGGSPWNGQARTYYIPSTDSNAYAIGDPVKTLSTGGDANGVPGVTIAVAGASNAIRGVIVGIGAYEGGMFVPSFLDSIVIPATKTRAYYVMVVDDPAVMFSVQEADASGSPLTAANCGQNINLLAGANNGFISGWQLDNTTVANTATLQMRLWGLIRTIDNAFGAQAKWLCTINQHELALGTAGV